MPRTGWTRGPSQRQVKSAHLDSRGRMPAPDQTITSVRSGKRPQHQRDPISRPHSQLPCNPDGLPCRSTTAPGRNITCRAVNIGMLREPTGQYCAILRGMVNDGSCLEIVGLSVTVDRERDNANNSNGRRSTVRQSAGSNGFGIATLTRSLADKVQTANTKHQTTDINDTRRAVWQTLYYKRHMTDTERTP
jgi:hypothetical protein